MTTTLNPTITITVSGPTGSGKSRVLAVIADVLKLIHSDCIIDAPDVKAEKEMCGDDHTAWHKPRSGTLFKLEEINQPVNTGRCIATPMTVEDPHRRTATQGAAAPTDRRRRVRDMSQAEALEWFAQYGFTDTTGHALLQCEDFRELLALALNHKDASTHDKRRNEIPDDIRELMVKLLQNKTSEEVRNILTGMVSLNAARIKRQQWEAGVKSRICEQLHNTQPARAITAVDLYDRPVPAHIQKLMQRLGISMEAYVETDLQPVVDLVNWALLTPQINAAPPAPDAGVNRLFGVTAGSRMTYTLSTDALSSRDALKKMEKAINRMKSDSRSHFAEGEANTMLIDDVRATSGDQETGK
ncbi:TPA: hypothetical protein ACISZU_000168 [Salmonella enterica subsp. enterica serovar Potsdam]